MSTSDESTVSGLKRQIAKLRKENAKLKKQKNRIDQELLEMRDTLADTSFEVAEPTEPKAFNACPHCKNVVNLIELAGTPYYNCTLCGKKGKYTK
jgi:predicted  nucleic acid-binding Zn-ribbon protein